MNIDKKKNTTYQIRALTKLSMILGNKVLIPQLEDSILKLFGSLPNLEVNSNQKNLCFFHLYSVNTLGIFHIPSSG